MPVLNFKGRTAIRSHHFTVPFYPLEIDAKKSFATNPASKPSLEDNLIIHGDNLHALKALVPHYGGKIKCIYIDPPYNTGNENWKYNDNVNNPMMQRWLKENGIGRDDMERHDKWLCMMWPRLELLKVLLAEDGVIFISIDENEQHRLRMLLDEIFGEENFLSQITWRNKKEISSDSKGVSSKTEFILIYVKGKLFIPNKLNLREEYIQSSFKNPNNDPKGPWRGVAITVSKGHQGRGYEYEIITPQGKKFKREWLYPESSYKNLVQKGSIYFGKEGKSIPQRIMYLKESKGQTPDNLWLETGTNKDGKNELTNLFREMEFDNRKHTPKPMSLISKVLRLSSDKNAVILDSFAGSGTTAHAVLDLNKEDGGKRKFILVECEDYANDITAERVRRVIKGVPTAKDSKLQKGLGDSFTYCNLGPEFNEEGFLKCKSLPTYEVLARYVFYTATSEALQEFKKRGDYYVGKTKHGIAIFVVYEPDKEFLRSEASALHAQREASVLQTMQMEKCRQAYVFAIACFVPPEDLPQKRIVFCQMPFQIHKML